MAPMPSSPGAKLKPMTPSQSHLPVSAQSATIADKVGAEAATCDSTDTTHMTNCRRDVELALNGSKNNNSKNNNNNNNNNNISEKTSTAMTKATTQQHHSNNDFITNFFNNLKSTMQQQQQQQQQQQKLASDNKDALYPQTAAVVTTTAPKAAAVTTTTTTARCDSSSSYSNNNSTGASNANKSKESENVASVVIKTEVDATANPDIKQQQEEEQEMSPTSTSSSTSSAVTSSTTHQLLSSTSTKIPTATTTTTITTTTIKARKSSFSPNNEKENQSLGGDNDSDNLIFAKPIPVLLSAVNPHIICNLCYGYLIDATTIVECLHSFCHSCIMRHLRTEQYCPRCEMMINTAKPNIKSDTTLQAIVYKLVPGLYEKELMRKRAFYKNKPEEAALATPEQRGDDTEHLIFSPSEYMSLSLEYADIEEHIGISADSEFAELLKPKFLQCPSICTVAHLKKFVYGKFDIDMNLYNVDIMYKVKTIVLLDHYTLMDVAYIYTWKRDAPMRFYFRVRETPPKPVVKVRKPLPLVETKQEVLSDHEEPGLEKNVMTIVQQAESSCSVSEVLPVTHIKQENETDPELVLAPEPQIILPQPAETKTFEIVPQSTLSSNSGSSELSKTDKLKITIVTKGSRDKRESSNSELVSPVSSTKSNKEKKESAPGELKDERKVENIKLKIDLSKQNSVTIINMSDPERKEIVKPVKPDREWKVKTKKDKGDSPKSSPSSDRERKRKTPSPLTVPPLTIKAERISPLAKTTPKVQSPNVDSSSSASNTEEEEKSQFLKSFALAPIKDVKQESPEKTTTPPKNQLKQLSPPKLSIPNALALMGPPSCVFPKPVTASKRKSKEPLKAIPKKPKFAYPLPTDDFKIKLPPSPHAALKPPKPMASSPSYSPPFNEKSADKLMPPPAPLTAMRPPTAVPKRPNKFQNKFAPPGSLTPHPSQGFQTSSPGNRTPIAKRYQPILPKASRPNPFANIPTDVNKILKDAGTEIKSISSSDNCSNPKIVYGPKTPQKSSMGPPPTPLQSSTSSPSHGSRSNPALSSNKTTGSNNYLNLALFNSSKSKGNEVPPGCRTPMYSPNSPIYSPSSPQYSPNYNIPTIPTYKYTPKPSSANSSYFQNVLGSNSQLSSLFPAPPTKKPCSENTPLPHSNSPLKSTESTPKRVYPFAKSPSPVEDPPEKQLKVKSLLTSCNINIPSSLSITITREDSESQSNNTSYPKHKSPVNNYIEILKLPDQPVESHQIETTKRPSPPKQTQAAITKKENNATQPPQNRINATQNGLNTKLTSNPPPKHMTFNFTKPPVSMQNMNSALTSIVTTPNLNTKTTKTTNTKTNASIQSTTSNNKPQMPPPTVNPMKTNSKVCEIPASVDKKTPSPEKRPSSNAADFNSPTNQGENKSPKSPNADSAAAKKFRHILPRQNPTAISEVIPPKVTAGNIIGTYSSPSGVAVKVHASKKVPPSKKSPNCVPPPQNCSTNGTKAPLPKSSPNSSVSLVKPTTDSPKSSPNQSKNSTTSKSKKSVANNSQAPFTPATMASTMPSSNVLNKLVPTSHSALNSMPTLPPPHAMQPHTGLPNMPAHLGVANQAELGQFLKDNLLRVQAQAAAANQSNIFYSYANAAAQMSQFAPSLYNYPQAYIMEQLSRMQRAGNEAFVEYMQKLKNGSIEKIPTSGESEQSDNRILPSPKPSSPKTTPQAISSSNSSQKNSKPQQPTAKTK